VGELLATRFHIGAKHSVQAAEVTLALFAKPLQHIAVHAKMTEVLPGAGLTT